MKKSQEVLQKAKIVPLLRLATRDESGVVRGTGLHRVKLVKDEVGKRTDRQGKLRLCMWYYVEEEEVIKRYPVWLFSDEETKEVHYLVQRLAEIPENTEIILEYKKQANSPKGFIDVRLATETAGGISDAEIPIIDEENYEEKPRDIEETEGEELNL